MPDLSGRQLEDHGRSIFEALGLICINRLNNVRLQELDPGAPFPPDEHLEIDYLIPYRNYCLIGEITGRSSASDVGEKYRKVLRHFDFLRRRHIDNGFWTLLGVPSEQLRFFSDISEFRAFYIITNLQKFDVNLSPAPNVVIFHSETWKLLEEYSRCIGKYALHAFTSGFDVARRRGHRPIRIGENTHSLVKTTGKKVAGGDTPLADIFTFEVSPYEILAISQVFRKDALPDISTQTDRNYQRPLIPEKLKKIRTNLLSNPDFMFPNGILVVLSSECRYDDVALQIPEIYGAITIIDGQHRLFSYANENLETRLRDCSKIMVTAIKFSDADAEQVRRFSARTFIEINMNQTRIASTHLDAIGYPILNETHSRAIAAQVILRANERRGRLRGLFKTSQTSIGVIQTTTILTVLRPMTNIDTLVKLTRTRGERLLKLRQGYENLFELSIGELTDPVNLIQRSEICLCRYFNIVASIFHHDWPQRNMNRRIGSALEFTKMFAAMIRLFHQFIKEGLNWPQVQVELENIRNNILRLRRMSIYDRVLLDKENPNIPGFTPSVADDFKFLNLNRTRPTSIRNI